MKFFVDSADSHEIEELKKLDLVDGVTTNPSLIAKSGLSREEVATRIAHAISGPVSVEVLATEYSEMLSEAKILTSIAKNICIKVPATSDGLRACKALRSEGKEVNVTLCFSANQALLAARAGATFISPFVGRVDDINLDGMELISEIRQIYCNFGMETKILVASVRTVNHVKQAALIGADALTAPPAVLKALIKHPLTDKGLQQFLDDSKSSRLNV